MLATSVTKLLKYLLMEKHHCSRMTITTETLRGYNSFYRAVCDSPFLRHRTILFEKRHLIACTPLGRLTYFGLPTMASYEIRVFRHSTSHTVCIPLVYRHYTLCSNTQGRMGYQSEDGNSVSPAVIRITLALRSVTSHRPPLLSSGAGVNGAGGWSLEKNQLYDEVRPIFTTAFAIQHLHF